MSSTKKGNNYHFGMKAHNGVDAESGLVHTLGVTTAKFADDVMTGALLHSEETGRAGRSGQYAQRSQSGGGTRKSEADLAVFRQMS